ncbi:hypothetical protein [Paenibacillus sp. N3.4]|uniref:hypothetical protein n=1 Tax=Paenibacillus sp. N3.4 TaxID=2603222 RepID=UPI0011CB3CC5|nr:hypothetical protein [Paenibacillus sp. N3.4]TXK85800.1 hypothetical protein FU659_02555 [Paenibacillus sp. N3.4]
MREIDINHVMNQLGIQPIQLQRWQTEQAKQAAVDRACLLEASIETLTELMSESSSPLSI